jgi:hypothetical protein
MGRGGSGGLTHLVLMVVVLAAGGVYSMHIETVPPSVGFALLVSLVALILASLEKVPVAASIAADAVALVFGLAIVLAMAHDESKAGRVLRNLAWSQALLGAWVTYSAASANSASKRILATFGDEDRARWRAGDVAFGLDLSRRIIVSAQPSWAALVVETAWPEPRPEPVVELLRVAAGASVTEARTILERIRDKGGTELAEARWALARAACEVVIEARSREDTGDVGGAAVARLVVAAAKVVRDDEDAVRIFSALILPAIARRA